jgi:hypothetical protein
VTLVNGVTFPAIWIPPPEIVPLTILYDLGMDILTVAGAALDLFGLGERYERKYVGAGAEAALEPSRAGQLTVNLTKHMLGRQGAEQFQFDDGAIGKYAFETANYSIEVTLPYPKRGQVAAKTPDIATYTSAVQRDSYVVFEAMKGVALGGIVPPMGGQLQIRQAMNNKIMVGPLAPKGPAGGEASYTMTVAVQL